jgi:hypothetical protein
MMELSAVLTLEEAAELVGRSPTTLRDAALRGRLEARRIGDDYRGLWITTEAAVAAYIASTREARRPRPRPRR